jgi:tRNA threonylcarbamoyladenosine biosynthesis protein TsaB
VAIILYLETATTVCSVALTKNNQLMGLRETTVSNSHSELLTVFIHEVLTESGISFSEIDAVAVSKGPGSYTGLRIGVSTAKGICYALDKPLIAIGTLLAMARGAAQTYYAIDSKTLICPMLDARRMEVYYALFDHHLNVIKPDCAAIITENYFSDILTTKKLILLGDGAEKCMPLFNNHPNIKLISNFSISAKYMMLIASQYYYNNKFEDLAYFEPFYLKDFIAAKPVVKGLH